MTKPPPKNETASPASSTRLSAAAWDRVLNETRRHLKLLRAHKVASSEKKSRPVPPEAQNPQPDHGSPTSLEKLLGGPRNAELLKQAIQRDKEVSSERARAVAAPNPKPDSDQ